MSYSELANPRATRDVLQRFGHDPKYRLGQNFLVDDNVIARIIELSGLENADAKELPTVLEIGPGIGTLSVALLKYAHVIAVEMDRDLPAVLAETTALNGERFELISGDALKVGLKDIETACRARGFELPHMLVSNLPYQIAATVILDWFERFEFLDTAVVMVQSEVADRIAAELGSKDYAAYTVKLRMHARVVDRFQVSSRCFMPAPRVESAVIRLERATTCADQELVAAASRVADAAFAQRRKNIRNSMRSSFDKGLVDELLARCGIEPTVRGETLTVEHYLELGRTLLELERAGRP